MIFCWSFLFEILRIGVFSREVFKALGIHSVLFWFTFSVVFITCTLGLLFSLIFLHFTFLYLLFYLSFKVLTVGFICLRVLCSLVFLQLFFLFFLSTLMSLLIFTSSGLYCLFMSFMIFEYFSLFWNTGFNFDLFDGHIFLKCFHCL